MPTRAGTTHRDTTTTDDGALAHAWSGAAHRRFRTWLSREQAEEDGVFRPVRLPMWIDLGISAAIIVLVAGAFAGFIVFLARTQGR